MFDKLHAAGSILSTSLRNWSGPASRVLAEFLEDARLRAEQPATAPAEKNERLTFADYLRDKPQLHLSHSRGPIQ